MQAFRRAIEKVHGGLREGCLVLVACSALASCSAAQPESSDAQNGATEDAGSRPKDGSSLIGCADDERALEYEAGLGLDGENGLVRFELRSAEPAPPARGENTWVLELRAVDGELPGDLSVSGSPFMPDHGHGSVAREAVPSEEGYELRALDFFMPGLWRVGLEVTSESEDFSDQAELHFCVEG